MLKMLQGNEGGGQLSKLLQEIEGKARCLKYYQKFKGMLSVENTTGN